MPSGNRYGNRNPSCTVNTVPCRKHGETHEHNFDTDPSNNATVVTVRLGDVEVTANNQSFPVHAGQSAYFDNSGNPPDIEYLGPPDDFDGFIVSRDRIEDVPPPQYVSPDMVGYEDFIAYGAWRNTPEGPVWFPRVAAGWIPYRTGNWAWISPWGWTWVDDEPWGFAPFHYGRWAYVDNAWGWYPGPVAPRVYYAPALVAFVGGSGFTVSLSVGGLIGWFALGPAEPYYPSYQVSPNYIQQINITNTRITNINVTNINVTNITYVNRTAVVAVPQNSFVSAQPVQSAAVRVDPNQIRQAQVIGAAPKVAPQPQSVLANPGGGRGVTPPASLASHPVVAKLAPPPRPVPFAAQQQALQQHPGVPVAQAQLQTLRAQSVRANPTPAGMQIKAIDTKQVRPITPIVRNTPAPVPAQRIAQAPKTPQAAPVGNGRPAPASAPVPAVGNVPPGGGTRAQTPPPPAARVPASPPAPPPAAPAARSPIPTEQRPAPSAPAQPPPAVRPQAPCEETQPPSRPAPAPREQAPPPARPGPAVEPRPAPARPQASPPRPEAQQKHEPPPPAQKAAPPKAKQEEKRPEEKKREEKE
jgi:hypothetical protein